MNMGKILEGITPNLRDRILKEARNNGRRWKGEAIHRLERSFEDDILLQEINRKLDLLLAKERDQ